MNALYWITSIASMVGVVLNIHGRRAAYGIWAVTNVVWVVADVAHGLPQQATQQAVYFGLSLYGLWKWRSGAPRRFGTGPRTHARGQDPA